MKLSCHRNLRPKNQWRKAVVKRKATKPQSSDIKLPFFDKFENTICVMSLFADFIAYVLYLFAPILFLLASVMLIIATVTSGSLIWFFLEIVLCLIFKCMTLMIL